MVFDGQEGDTSASYQVEDQETLNNKLANLVSFFQPVSQPLCENSCLHRKDGAIEKRAAGQREATNLGDDIVDEPIEKPLEVQRSVCPQERLYALEICREVLCENRPLNGHAGISVSQG